MISRLLLEKNADLARLGRCEAQLKLRIAELLDALFQRGGHHDLGFSSFEAYVVERCERSRSWGRETRWFARRLREGGLSGIRSAVRSGRLSWSMAELLARHATRENETALLERAVKSTVRTMHAQLTGKERAASKDQDEPRLRATYWVDDADVAMLSASRVLVEYLNGARANDEELMTALLGEAETSLQSMRNLQPDREKIEAIAHVLREATVLASSDLPVAATPPVLIEVAEDEPLPNTLRGLDREITRCCSELARRNLQIGRLITALHASGAWRKLGYQSLAQYANERVGLSLSSLEHRMTLARRVATYPNLGTAIDRGTIGYEAALLISRVIGRFASRALVDAWIERARQRTVKHLREEVDAVVLAGDLSPDTSRFPPDEDDLEAVFDFQRKIQSGELLRAYAIAGARVPQMSVRLNNARRPLKLSISPDLYAHWQNVEAQFRRIAGAEASFVAFLCTSFWDTWLPFVEVWDDKWKKIYQRDRHRCTSPVCERRDVTPHHLHFKSHGGTDAPENMSSICAWCHLFGIHHGRLQTEGPASNLTWIIGSDPIIVVNRRQKAAS